MKNTSVNRRKFLVTIGAVGGTAITYSLPKLKAIDYELNKTDLPKHGISGLLSNKVRFRVYDETGFTERASVQLNDSGADKSHSNPANDIILTSEYFTIDAENLEEAVIFAIKNYKKDWSKIKIISSDNNFIAWINSETNDDFVDSF
jgi:hypothetical protein